MSIKQTLRDAQEGQERPEGQEGPSGSGREVPAAAPSSEGAAARGTGKQPASSEAPKGEAPTSSGKSPQEAEPGKFWGGLAAGDGVEDGLSHVSPRVCACVFVYIVVHRYKTPAMYLRHLCIEVLYNKGGCIYM